MGLRLAAPRIIAGVLAIGGIYWGVLLLPLIPHAEHPLLPLLVFGPGYVVTLAYLIRVVTCPPLRGRQILWGFSVLVQGGWLLCYVVVTLANGGPIPRLVEPHTIVAWWAFATAGSVVALVLERAAA